MKLAILPRIIDLGKEKAPSNQKLYTNCDFEVIAKELGVGLCSILSPYEFEDICEICDGLIIPGSNTKVNPLYYGEEPMSEKQVFDEFALDSKLIDYFVKNDKPILGICAGHQAINIYFGGSIDYITPDKTTSHHRTVHPIDITPGSFVYDAFGAESAEINSYHFMHINRLGKDLEVVARSKEGVIEAIQHKEKKVFGVQWHPERNFEEEKKIFENFLDCCKK